MVIFIKSQKNRNIIISTYSIARWQMPSVIEENTVTRAAEGKVERKRKKRKLVCLA